MLAAAVSNSDDVEDRLDWWDRCNRSALILCSAFPSLVVNYDDLVGRPKSVLTEIVEFLGDLGVTVDTDVGHAAAQLETLVPGPQLPEAPTNIDNNHLILNRILDQLDGHRGEQIADKDSLAELTRVTADFYDEITTSTHMTSEESRTRGQRPPGSISSIWSRTRSSRRCAPIAPSTSAAQSDFSWRAFVPVA